MIDVELKQVELDAIISTQNMSVRPTSNKQSLKYLKQASHDPITLSLDETVSPKNKIAHIHEESKFKQQQILEQIDKSPPGITELPNSNMIPSRGELSVEQSFEPAK